MGFLWLTVKIEVQNLGDAKQRSNQEAKKHKFIEAITSSLLRFFASEKVFSVGTSTAGSVTGL